MNDTSKKVDTKMSHWKFDQKVADVFDDHVRQSVPMYDEMHKLVSDISCWFVTKNTNVYDIGTSTGQALESIYYLHIGKDVNFIGYDTSRNMLFKARQRLNDMDDICISYGDITDESLEIRNASYVTSILTLQFVDPSKRQDAVNRIYKGLNVGGAFVMIEKIIGSTPRFDQMYVELYHELKLQNGLSIDHVLNKARSLRGVQRPYTIDENREMLKNAGFKDIDIFFKWSNFTGFIATK